MFDPRTLPNGDLAFNLAVVAWYAAMVVDVLVTRWGIWHYGLAEGNPLMRWFTAKEHPFRTFLDAGVLRPAVVLAFLVAAGWAGVIDQAHAYLPAGLAGATLIWPVKNYLKIRKLKK